MAALWKRSGGVVEASWLRLAASRGRLGRVLEVLKVSRCAVTCAEAVSLTVVVFSACAETCAGAVSSTGVVFSGCAEVRSDVRRGSFLDRGRVFVKK